MASLCALGEKKQAQCGGNDYMSNGERPEHGVTLIAWAGLALAGLALAGLLWRGCTAAPQFHVPAEAGRTLEEAAK